MDCNILPRTRERSNGGKFIKSSNPAQRNTLLGYINSNTATASMEEFEPLNFEKELENSPIEEEVVPTAVDQRRVKYGHLSKKKLGSDNMMIHFMKANKSILVYWAEEIKGKLDSNINPETDVTICNGEVLKSQRAYITYDTFKNHVTRYLKDTGQKLSKAQKAKVIVNPSKMQEYIDQYLHLQAEFIIQNPDAKHPLNKSQFFETYVVVPPYELVPSFELFIKKLRDHINENDADDLHQQNSSLSVAVLEDVSIAADDLFPPDLFTDSLMDTLQFSQPKEISPDVPIDIKCSTQAKFNLLEAVSNSEGEQIQHEVCSNDNELSKPLEQSIRYQCLGAVASNSTGKLNDCQVDVNIEVDSTLVTDIETTTNGYTDDFGTISVTAADGCYDSTRKRTPTLHSVSRIEKAYQLINSAFGGVGGNGSGGPIYGELTSGSMQLIIDTSVEFCELDRNSRFVDIGSGCGKPNAHVAQDPGVRMSIGVEVEPIRYQVS